LVKKLNRCPDLNEAGFAGPVLKATGSLFMPVQLAAKHAAELSNHQISIPEFPDNSIDKNASVCFMPTVLSPVFI
jgi:hypothetical protein